MSKLRTFLETLPNYPSLEIRPALGNQPLVVEEETTVWLVVEGTLDLFLVPLEDGQPQGLGFHMLQIETGGALFGMGRLDGYRLLARGGVATEVLRAPRAQLEAFATHQPEMFFNLVENWVQALQSAGAPGRVPGACRTLLAGSAQQVSGGDSLAVSARCLWVASQEGDLRLFGQQATAPRIPFPLSRPAWLSVAQDLQVDVWTSAEVVEQKQLWASLGAFHQAISGCAVAAMLARRQQADRRILDVSNVNKQAFTGAIQAMRSVIPAAGQAPGSGSDSLDPLLAACQLVGQAIQVESMRRPSHRSRSSGDEVSEIAHASRVRVRGVSLVGRWYRTDSGPMLGFLQDGHPVALMPVGSHSYDLIDPRDPRPLRIDRARARQLAPAAYTFYQPLPNRPIQKLDLVSIGISMAKADLRTILAMAVLGGLLGLVQPVATGLLISQIVPSDMRSELYDLGAALLACSLASGAFEFTRSIALLRLDGKMDGALQSAVFDRLLRLPAPFFNRFSTGDLDNRALGINAIRQAMSGAALNSLMGGLTSVFSFLLLFYYSWQLALVAVLLVSVYLTSIGLVAYLQLRYQRPLLDTTGQISGLLLQLLNGIRKLRGAGAEARAFHQWSSLFAKERKMQFQLGMVSVQNSAFQAAYSTFCSAVLFAFLAWRGYKLLSPGDIAAFFAAFGQFISAMTSVSGALTSLVAIGPTLDRARPILDEPTEASDERPDPEPLDGRLELKGVTFRYQKDGPVALDDIDLVAAPGEFIAIVGPSGAGKSTLLRLLLGFEKPESGTILFDGQDLQAVNLQSLRRQLGVVLQETRLMPGSILKNIIGSSLLTIEDAWEAAAIAGIAEDIQAMPMGMHTVVTEGVNFSGGQLQRLVIARAVVTRPRVLFFDEATSALDNATQEHVSRGLEGLKATRIVIAHRLSTIQNADRIYVLDAKTRRFAQVGTYTELLNQPGEFQDLARRQMA